jgi:hypothetical protein
MATGFSYEPRGCWKRRDSLVDRRGYVRVWVPEHPRSFKGGWVYEHRLVMEAFYERLLRHFETVHHINEVKHDNRLENLVVCLRGEHDKAHQGIYVA